MTIPSRVMETEDEESTRNQAENLILRQLVVDETRLTVLLLKKRRFANQKSRRAGAMGEVQNPVLLGRI